MRKVNLIKVDIAVSQNKIPKIFWLPVIEKLPQK